MGKLAELNIPTREGNLRNPERLNQGLKDIGRKAEPLNRLATEGFGQVLLGDEGTIPWYMSFAPGADLTDKLMEGRQPGLLDVPGPGTLAKIAMLPIMKLGAKEILEGTARMGKNARNLDKAKNPVIERWHRTRRINDDNIREKGLLVGKDNPNYGKNTGDQGKLKIPAAWLGTNPTEIPVLQYYAINRPGELSTYRVRIPKEEYYSTPRLKWDSGYRGDASDARIVGKGESSLTGEVGRRTGNKSLIDLFGKSIPPEYLEKMLDTEITRRRFKNLYLNSYIDELGNGPESIPLSKAGTMLADEDLNWMPFRDRIFNYTKLKDVGAMVSEDIKRKPDVPPSKHLRDALNFNFAPNQRGKIEIPAYGYGMFDLQSRGIPSNRSRPVGKFERSMRKPRHLFEITIPTDEQIQFGSISRGLSPITGEAGSPKNRMMNWGSYQDALNRGMPPSVAMGSYGPREILIDNPQGLGVKKFPKSAEGLISRGLGKGRRDMRNRLSDISEIDDTRTFNAYLKQIENPHLKSVILEKIFNSDGALGRLKDLALGLDVRAASGHMGRGYTPSFYPSLTGLLREGIEYNTKELGLPLNVARERTFNAIKSIMEDNIGKSENRPSAVVKSIGDLVDDRTVHIK